MYLPEHFENADVDRTLSIMRAFPLATLISVDADHQPVVSHLPLVVEHSEAGLICVGHLARANPQWPLLRGGVATAIFHGPDAYITPTWYAENAVPTWNYAVVHARGPVTLIETHDGIIRCLEKLTALVEQGENRWSFWIPDDLAGVVAQSIVGVQLRVETLQAKFKLSQNRSDADRDGVIRGLHGRADAGSHALCALMEQLRERTV